MQCYVKVANDVTFRFRNFEHKSCPSAVRTVVIRTRCQIYREIELKKAELANFKMKEVITFYPISIFHKKYFPKFRQNACHPYFLNLCVFLGVISHVESEFPSFRLATVFDFSRKTRKTVKVADDIFETLNIKVVLVR